MRVAYFSPMPPEPSGIADYSANLLPSLAQHWDVTLFVAQATVEFTRDMQALPVRSIDSFGGPINDRYSMCVYQMGNNIHYHKQIYATLLRFPGVVVLHDPNLHAFQIDYAMQGEYPRGQLVREFSFAYSGEGTSYVRQLLQAGGPREDARFPSSARLAQASTGVIVHSEYARRLVLRDCPGVHIAVTQQPVPLVQRTLSNHLAKERLGLPDDAILLSSFGYASPNKHIHTIIEILPKLRTIYPELHYAVIGRPIAGYNLTKLVEESGLQEYVHLIGYAESTTYTEYLLATDLGINLRYPTTGETSAALLNMMAAGIPCIVVDIDAFSELPDEAVVKLQAGVTLGEELAATLEALIQNPDWRAQLADRALHYIESQANPARVAFDYAKFAAEAISMEHLTSL